ncbi:uncharacterized protein LOC113450575, partial [Tachysurus ichikawai]
MPKRKCCPAHILNNCVHHGADTLDVDIEHIIFKIYQHFHIYTVCTESLKEYFKSMLAQNQKDGYGQRCEHFSAQVQGLYSTCLDYLEKWMAPMEEFSTFMWMDLSEIPDWNDVEGCIRHLAGKGVDIDDSKCFHQVTNLKNFIERSNSDADFSDLQAHQRWTKFFERSKSVDFNSELLKMAQFFCFFLPYLLTMQMLSVSFH